MTAMQHSLRVGLTDEPRHLTVPRWLHPLWVAAVAIPAVLASAIYLGAIPAGIVGASAGVAFVGWLATTYRQPASRRVLPWCIGTIVVLIVQAWEQWATGYADTLIGWFPDAFPTPVVFDTATWFLVLPLSATVLFLFGTVGVFLHHPIGNYLAWLTFATAAVVGLSHPLALAAAGLAAYVPGLYSAAPLVAVAAAGMRQLVTDRIDRTAS